MKTHNSNMNHRPIGIGLQGLADTFAIMGMSFDSDEAENLNKDIFETIYYGSIKRSNTIAKQRSTEMQRLQQEFVFDLFNNIPGYLKWFIPFFREVQYNKNFSYYKKINIQNYIAEHITKIYHEYKPNMKEIFGMSFYLDYKAEMCSQ